MSKSHDDDHSDEKTTIVKGDTFRVRMEEATKTPPCLVMLEGPAGYVGKQWPIDKVDLIIGRSMSSSIFVDDRSVSKSHAKISNANGEVFILDLESTNRTVVNDDTLPPLVPMKLNTNDQIKTGNVLFKFLEGGSIEAHAMEQLQNKSEKDPLTGAFNKGALHMKGAESFKRAKLLKVPMSISVFDIDHFKKVNDTYGHSAGDFVLKELAQVISTKLIRLDDYFARYGGEEFVVVLFGSNLTQAAEIGERLRATIESHSFVFNGTKLPITISVGVASIAPQMSTWEEMFTKADDALYQSKRGGRNRVTSSD
ncbi:MAG TPA: diguanylate cyclase [Bdellovibrionales bacterium]|nr:diguanylate cyclase [Bdellovibrionales bacterium]